MIGSEEIKYAYDFCYNCMMIRPGADLDIFEVSPDDCLHTHEDIGEEEFICTDKCHYDIKRIEGKWYQGSISAADGRFSIKRSKLIITSEVQVESTKKRWELAKKELWCYKLVWDTYDVMRMRHHIPDLEDRIKMLCDWDHTKLTPQVIKDILSPAEKIIKKRKVAATRDNDDFKQQLQEILFTNEKENHRIGNELINAELKLDVLRSTISQLSHKV